MATTSAGQQGVLRELRLRFNRALAAPLPPSASEGQRRRRRLAEMGFRSNLAALWRLVYERRGTMPFVMWRGLVRDLEERILEVQGVTLRERHTCTIKEG